MKLWWSRPRFHQRPEWRLSRFHFQLFFSGLMTEEKRKCWLFPSSSFFLPSSSSTLVLYIFFFTFGFWLRAHAPECTCAIFSRAIEAVCVCESACVWERANVFVHYWWVPESPFHLSPSLQMSRLAHGCTPPSPLYVILLGNLSV